MKMLWVKRKIDGMVWIRTWYNGMNWFDWFKMIQWNCYVSELFDNEMNEKYVLGCCMYLFVLSIVLMII